MRNNASVTCAFSSFDSIKGFSQSTDLVYFNKDSICYAFVDALNEAFFVGNEQVVAYQLNFFTNFLGQKFPASPIVFSQTIFNGNDGIFFAKVCQIINHFFRSFNYAFTFQMIFAVFVHFAACNVQCNYDIFFRFVTSFNNCFQNNFDSFCVVVQVRSKATFITQSSAQTFFFQQCFQIMVDFCVHTQSFAKGFCAYRHNHKFLNVNIVVSVFATVQNVHHGNGQFFSCNTAQVQVQRQANRRSCCSCYCHRNTKNCVCTKSAFIGSTVQTNQQFVNFSLTSSFQANQSFCDDIVNIINCFSYTFTKITVFVTITQFYCFMYASRSTGRNCSTTNSAIFQNNFNFYGRIAAGIKNLTSIYFGNHCHNKIHLELLFFY